MWGYVFNTIGGNGSHIKLEFYSADGTLAAETYTPCATEGSPAEGEFNYGYDYVSDWGSSVYGSCVTSYANDQASGSTKINDGTITVTIENGVYTITLDTTAVKGTYVGKLSAE